MLNSINFKFSFLFNIQHFHNLIYNYNIQNYKRLSFMEDIITVDINTQDPNNLLVQQPILLQSTDNSKNQPLEQNQIKKSSNLDDLPVGGGKKFVISEYPDQNAPVKTTKKNINNKKKKPQTNQALAVNEQKVLTQLNNFDQKPIQGATVNSFDPTGKTNFDQKPIGKTNFTLSQFPQGEEIPQQKPINLTMEQKLKSKTVKIRMSGFQELHGLLTTNPITEPPLNELQFDKFLKQTNPGCLQKILMCFQLWVNKEGNWGEQEIKLLVQNGYINGKGTSKKISGQLVDYMYQKKGAQVQQAILNGLKGKTLKIVAGYITLINQLLSIYGIKKMNFLKPYYPDVIKLISNQKLPIIKTEGMTMLKEALKWLGKPFLQPYFKANNLKQGLSKQIDQFWEAHDKKIVMSAPKEQEKFCQVDIFKMSQQIDIFKKYNQKWVQNVLKTQKWKQKCDLMLQLVKQASIPKISNKQHRHIGDLVKRLIQDSNFNVVLAILKILGAISQGLRKPFSPIVKNNFRNVINKFKDKKTLMIDETNNCLNEFYYVITLEQVIDDVKQGLSDKNPNMKMHLIAWIERYIERKVNEKALNDKGKQAIKALIPNFQKLCNDGVAQVRQSSLKALSKMKSNLGQNFFSALQTKLGKSFNFVGKQSKQTKKQEKIEVKVQVKPEQKSAPTSNQPKLNAFKSVNSIPKAQKKIQEKIEDFEVPTYQQCCQSLLQQGFSQQDFKIVTGNVPKEKTQFLQGLTDRISQNNFEAIIKVVRKMFKQWKQSNLVMNKQLFNFLLVNVQKITKRQYVIILPYLLQKLGDSKFTESLKGITEVLCQKISPKFLVNQILKYLKPTQTKKITPKLNNQSCIFISEIIDKVSLNYLPFKELLQLSRECFQVVLSKKGAIILIKKIYQYMGEPMKACLDEAIVKSIDAQLKKIVVLTEQEKKPKISFRGQALQQIKGQKVVNPLQTLPRVDISNDITRFMSKLNDQANWQFRKQALQGLDNLLSQSKNRIQMTGLSELINSLKNRISDSNKQVTKTSIGFTSHLVESVGKQIKSQSKILIYALIEILSDKNEIIRKDVVQCLSKIGQVLGMQWIISCMSGSLQTDKIELRLEVLNFILANQQFLLKVQLKQFTKGIINGLCDKNKDIRNLSQKILQKALQKVNLQVYRSIAKDFRPAFMKDLTILFDKFDKNSNSINLNTLANYSSVKGTSPARSMIQQQMKKPPISSKKQQLQSPIPNGSNTSIMLTRNQTQKNLIQKQMVQNNYTNNFQGDEPLAIIKYLSSFRQLRQQQDQQIPWNHQAIKQGKQQQLIQEINKIFRKDIATKMVSLNYKNTVQASAMITKLCRDMALHNSFRQIYDVIIKWIFLKIWGGNTSVAILVDILPPLLSILEKKSLIINENEVLLIIGVIRQQFISMYPDNKFNDGINTIIKCLLKLNSGQRVLKLILNQFSIDLTQIHKHLKKQTNNYYRECLSKIIKCNLMDFVGNQQFLSDISKIQSLSKDPEFIQMLYQRFNENGLNGYGFKREVVQNIKIINPNIPPNQNHQNPNQSINVNFNNQSSNQLNSSFLGGSQISQQPTKQTKIDNRRPPIQSLLQKTDSQSHLNQYPTISINNVPINKNNISVYPQQLSLYQRLLKIENFPYPPASNPLSEHLSKLYPPEDTTVNFFQTLFNQQSEKILSELQMFSKCILTAILKGTIDLLNKRSEYNPEKISTQLNLLQQALKNKQIIRNSGDILGIATQFVLKQLIFEDQNKGMITESFRQRGIDFKPEIFIKIINGIMLRILENAHPHQIIMVLFDLLIKNQKRQQISQKTLSLILKCLNRVSNSYMNQFQQNNIKELLLKFHQYNIQLQSKLKPQDQGLSVIKNMLTLISKQIKENIWIHYQRSMKDSNMADNFIHKFLQSLNIPYPEKPKPSQKQEQLKKITELLAKLKTYDSGIVLLNTFLDKNPEFQIAQYFSSLNYENKFIGKVLNSLQNNFKRPPPRTLLPERPEKKSEQRKYNNTIEVKSTEQNYIENKIKNLRQKFDQIHQGQKMEEQHHQHHTPVAQKQQQPDPDRASQIRRRITEMKAKIHNVMK